MAYKAKTEAEKRRIKRKKRRDLLDALAILERWARDDFPGAVDCATNALLNWTRDPQIKAAFNKVRDAARSVRRQSE